MKNIKFILVAAAIAAFAACGGQTKSQTEGKDSVKCFEQEQIEASIRVQLDSIASVIRNLESLPMLEQTKNGKIVLTDEEKQVKPDYLLDPAVADEALTLSEKYRTLVALSIDQAVAELYDMDVTGYNESTAKLIADINDPAFRIFSEKGEDVLESQEIYDAEAAAGRLNLFWQAVATSLVEQMYILTQNTDKFLPCFDDEAVANLTYRIALLQGAIDRLVAYDPDLVEVSEALSPLYNLNSLTVDELKKDLESMSGEIAAARNNLVK